MTKDGLIKLISKLGMANEIKPLINSEEDYDRFGKVVLNILESYMENPPQMRIFKKVYEGLNGGHIAYFIRKPEPLTYFKMIENFKMYYGVGVEITKTRFRDAQGQVLDKPMKKAEISRHEGVSRQIISKRINYLLAVLSRHKRDIWYDML